MNVEFFHEFLNFRLEIHDNQKKIRYDGVLNHLGLPPPNQLRIKLM